MNKIEENSFLPLFLFDSKYRFWRHLLFIIVGGIISFNQVFIIYQDAQEILGNNIYLICTSSFVLYLIVMYFNYFYLTPRFLLESRYIPYLVILCVIVFLLPTLSIMEEYFVRNSLGLPHRISSYRSPLLWIDNLSSSVITAVCFCGVSAIMLFRKWITGTEHVNRLEGEHLKSELNKLKGQIAPAFLSGILRKASVLAETDPEKTSGMLIQLGQLLRYQLYDCNREKILFKSEINFLSKFLELEKTNGSVIQYQIHMSGDVDNVFVSPMLFISLVQCIVVDRVTLDLSFTFENDTLTFICKTEPEKGWDDETFSVVKKRLGLQYPDKYRLTVREGMVELNLDISE